MSVKGRRREDGTSRMDLMSGDYCRTDGRWWVSTPDPYTGSGFALDDRWTVTEHEDGTITVHPSIDVRGVWHGWLQRGVWSSV